jgi:hypothetical protein
MYVVTRAVGPSIQQHQHRVPQRHFFQKARERRSEEELGIITTMQTDPDSNSETANKISVAMTSLVASSFYFFGFSCLEFQGDDQES